MSKYKETSYTVEKDRILKAANECPDADTIMRILFPEAFKETKRIVELGDCYDWTLAGCTYIVVRINMVQYSLVSLRGTWYSAGSQAGSQYDGQRCYDSLEELSDHIHDLQNAQEVVYAGRFKDLYLRER